MSQNSAKFSNRYIILFVSIVCFICALILSIFAAALKPLQEREEILYQSKQLLISAKILNDAGSFLIKNEAGQYIPAHFDPKEQKLIPNPPGTHYKASKNDIFSLQQLRVVPHLTDIQGNVFSFKEKKIDYETYLKEHQKYGYADLPNKLVYFIYPNIATSLLKKELDQLTPIGYVIPINGYGLWDAIYGYLAIEANANTVIGTTWYDQKETPGLGANIATPQWQKQFYGKHIFRENAQGQTNYQTSKLGITVVKTTVKDELGDSPFAISAVDGIAGASETRKGVQAAYFDSLAPYRPFLIKAHQRYLGEHSQ
ncbi:MAG: NADH:ubiquinone reductase (Na(+)-transporting) subunit C [Simkaniaceae bacterium]|nr:NADH:ubiquinone reductase (Na(+)-transporting) subunit C [Simkaniaceae bacterium]